MSIWPVSFATSLSLFTSRMEKACLKCSGLRLHSRPPLFSLSHCVHPCSAHPCSRYSSWAKQAGAKLLARISPFYSPTPKPLVGEGLSLPMFVHISKLTALWRHYRYIKTDFPFRLAFKTFLFKLCEKGTKIFIDSVLCWKTSKNKEGDRGKFGGEWICICIWLESLAVYLNYHNIVNWCVPI